LYSFWNNRRAITNDAGTPGSSAYEGRPVSAVLGWGGIKIFDDSADLLSLCAEYARAIQHYSCGQCIPCRSGSAVIKELFEGLIDGRGTEADLDTIASLSATISKTSMCQIGQSSPAVFTHVIENFRDRLVSGIGKGRDTVEARSVLTAPCMQACPIHLDIPAYVEAISKGRFEEALAIIRDKLPLPGVLGRICVRPCEFNCRRGVLDEPIQIKHLKRFVADFEIKRNVSPEPITEKKKDIKAAIVGAGPAGLTCAHFLVKKGYKVAVFEMLPEAGGMAAVGIPDYRLPREVITREVGYLEDMGVEFVYGKALGASFVIEDLEAEGFKAVFVGMGCHCHKPMGVEGEDKGYYGLVPGVYFLRNVNLGNLDELPKGKKMVVVGGGNVAIASEETVERQITKDGKWELAELVSLVPTQLLSGVENPAPPPPDLDLPGRPHTGRRQRHTWAGGPEPRRYRPTSCASGPSPPAPPATAAHSSGSCRSPTRGRPRREGTGCSRSGSTSRP